MLVKEIMSKKVVTVELDDTLALVKEIFEHSKFHHLLAMEKGELLGVVSDRDLFKALSPNIGTSVETYKDTATLNKKVHQIMSRRPKVLHEDATIDAAIDMFNEHGISCIPILAKDERLVGILSWRDILRNLRSTGATAPS
ncbi:CBS domain-containing protein [Duganella sp. HH105]|uniref:CBS domain-containing protein n=1 Tax=Duganella sp. HH105 TaxID=1781067 RepID=UPI000877BDF7|nr:CBS domain-containing protein [Duganella sp. HH105]OEZ51710.1 inosine-5'-monophosphate dehydrogenase [Duganella sp. HH105]